MFRKASIVARTKRRRGYNSTTGEADDPEQSLLYPEATTMEDPSATESQDNASDAGSDARFVPPPPTDDQADSAAGSARGRTSPFDRARPVPDDGDQQAQGQQGGASQEDMGESESSAPTKRTASDQWHRVGKAVTAAAKLARGPPPLIHLPGNVQGIDLSRRPEDWSWLSNFHSAECSILVVDFSPDQVQLHTDLTNASLPDFLAQPRPSWSRVRWISVDRLSWDVVQTLALRYNIHPLAVEDVLHIPQRIKADFYEHFLYVNLVLITLPTQGVSNVKAEPIRPATAVRSAVAAVHRRMHGGAAKGTAKAQPKAAQGGGTDNWRAEKAGGMGTATSAPLPEDASWHAPQGDGGRPHMEAGVAGAAGHGVHESRDECGDTHTSEECELDSGGDVLSSLPAKRLGRTMSIQRPHTSARVQVSGGRRTSDASGTRDHTWAATHGNSSMPAERHTHSAMDASAVTDTRHVTLDMLPKRHPRLAKDWSARYRSAQYGMQRTVTHRVGGVTASTTAHAAPPDTYCSEEGVPVHRQQVGIFVVDNNTIISIFEASGSVVTRNLLQQLRDPHTLSRDSGDASYLLCLLLDALADTLVPVVDSYSGLVEGYEASVLGGKPQAGLTRELHLVQQDLATLRRTVLPTLHLVTALRAHAASRGAVGAWQQQNGGRAAGAAGGAGKVARSAGSSFDGGSAGPVQIQQQTHTQTQGAYTHTQDVSQSGNGRGSSPGNRNKTEPGFGPHPLVSPLTKTYLGDVQDHLTTVLDAVDSQIEACRDLIDLAFNLIAHRTNEAMQALTVVSVLFLPLTFLAGIYGMNFDILPELHWTYGYAYFYGMCGVICVVFLGAMFRLNLITSG